MSRDSDEKGLLEGIVSSLQRVQHHAQIVLPSLRLEVNEIIAHNSTDKKRIENLLDTLFDFLYLGVGDDEFKSLVSYYRTVNRKNANFYAREYKKLLSEE